MCGFYALFKTYAGPTQILLLTNTRLGAWVVSGQPRDPVGMHGSSSQKSPSQHLFVLKPDLWKLDIFCSKDNSPSYSLCLDVNISFNVNTDFYGDLEGHSSGQVQGNAPRAGGPLALGDSPGQYRLSGAGFCLRQNI